MPPRRPLTDTERAHVFAILHAGRVELMRQVRADVRRIQHRHPRVAKETLRIAKWLYAPGRRPLKP